MSFPAVKNLGILFQHKLEAQNGLTVNSLITKIYEYSNNFCSLDDDLRQDENLEQLYQGESLEQLRQETKILTNRLVQSITENEKLATLITQSIRKNEELANLIEQNIAESKKMMPESC
jgi:hypothetical protein